MAVRQGFREFLINPGLLTDDTVEHSIGRKPDHIGKLRHVEQMGYGIQELLGKTVFSGWKFDKEASVEANLTKGGPGYGNHETVVIRDELTAIFRREVVLAEVEAIQPQVVGESVVLADAA